MQSQSISPLGPFNRYRNPQPPICLIEGCGNRTKNRGWCRLHYQHWYRYGDPLQGHQPPKPIPLTKICFECKREYPRTIQNFHRNSRGLDGLYHKCKQCLLAYHRRLIEANPEQYRATDRAYRKSHPEVHRARTRKFRANHREQRAEELKVWRAANPLRSRSYWQNRRARKAERFVEDVDLGVLYERDRAICQICSKHVARRDASVDHIIPLSKHGEHSYRNTQLAHRRCNSQRNVHGPAQIRLLP